MLFIQHKSFSATEVSLVLLLCEMFCSSGFFYIDGGKSQALSPGPLSPGEITFGTYWIEGREVLRANVDIFEENKSVCFYWGLNCISLDVQLTAWSLYWLHCAGFPRSGIRLSQKLMEYFWVAEQLSWLGVITHLQFQHATFCWRVQLMCIHCATTGSVSTAVWARCILPVWRSWV